MVQVGKPITQLAYGSAGPNLVLVPRTRFAPYPAASVPKAGAGGGGTEAARTEGEGLLGETGTTESRGPRRG